MAGGSNLGYRKEVVQVEDHGGPCGPDVVQVGHGEVDPQVLDEMAFLVQPRIQKCYANSYKIGLILHQLAIQT